MTHPYIIGWGHTPFGKLDNLDMEQLIRDAVRQARGNVAEAARQLGISRATVYRKLGTPKA